MKICQRTLKRLGGHVTGDIKLGPYRSGPALVDLFNEFGSNDVYPRSGGFPSRWVYAEDKLQKINGTPALASLIERIFDPLEFESRSLDHAAALEDINKHLQRDKYQVIIVDGVARVRPQGGPLVSFTPAPTFTLASDEFIREHIEKCERKLREGDYRGAITNARSLCEEVLCDIERHLDQQAKLYDGDLPRLFKRVRKALNMDPDIYKEKDAVLQPLNGMTSIVAGLAGMSNVMGDRHGGGGVRPKRHHAALAVNAANTLCEFVMGSYLHQIESKPKSS